MTVLNLLLGRQGMFLLCKWKALEGSNEQAQEANELCGCFLGFFILKTKNKTQPFASTYKFFIHTGP